MSPFKGAEKLIVESSDIVALRRFWEDKVDSNELLAELMEEEANDETVKEQLFEFFRKRKGEGHIADFLSSCEEHEMPSYITTTLAKIKEVLSVEAK